MFKKPAILLADTASGNFPSAFWLYQKDCRRVKGFLRFLSPCTFRRCRTSRCPCSFRTFRRSRESLARGQCPCVRLSRVRIGVAECSWFFIVLCDFGEHGVNAVSDSGPFFAFKADFALFNPVIALRYFQKLASGIVFDCDGGCALIKYDGSFRQYHYAHGSLDVFHGFWLMRSAIFSAFLAGTNTISRLPSLSG